MEIPPLDIDLDKVQPIDYVINRIYLGKQTHEGTVEDDQASFDNLVTSSNEERIKKDKLKKQVNQLTDILIKRTKSLEVIELFISSIDEQSREGQLVNRWIEYRVKVHIMFCIYSNQ